MEEIEIQKTTEEKVKELSDKLRPYFILLWNARKKLILFNTLVFILAVLYLLFLTKPYFTSTITILPEYGSKNTTLGRIGDLAAMAGVKVGEAQPTEIYQQLITSETVIEPVVYANYQTKEFKYPVNLITYFEIEPDKLIPDGLQKRKMFLEVHNELIKNRISTDVERMTKVLNLNVTMPESRLSADVANNIAASLDNYIRTKRKSYASEQRFYIDKRVKQIGDSLNVVENALRNFRERNRVIEQSPMLLLEQGRLMRQVEILQTVYTELTKQLELAKIDEIKDAPIVNIKEEVREPILKAGPKRMTKLIMILFLTIVISSGYFLLKNNLKIYYKIAKNSIH